MSRPLGVQPKVITFIVGTDTVNQNILLGGDGTTPTPGNIYSLNISWNGATVGDEMLIFDTASSTPTGTKLFAFRIPTTAGSFPAALPAVGLRAYNGAWLNGILAGGTFNLSFGISNGNG